MHHQQDLIKSRDNLMQTNKQQQLSKQTRPKAPSPDDIYDFSTKDLGY
jgi:hypothetical protein